MSKITGNVELKNWTPKIAANAARQRVRKIQLLLQEVASIYGDVFQPVVTDCDIAIDSLDGLVESINEAEETGATL